LIKLQFLDLFGDGEWVKKASNRHAMLFSRQRTVLFTRKRGADDSLLSDRTKVAKIEQSQVQAQSFVGTYTNPQAGATVQWPIAYAQKTPAQVASPVPAPTANPASAAAPAAAWTPQYPAQVTL
jgi:pre-mRNA-processing factor 39